MALETMDLHEVRSAMEGILFAAGEPVNIDRICLALELDKPTAEQVLQELGDYYAFERQTDAVDIHRLAGGKENALHCRADLM